MVSLEAQAWIIGEDSDFACERQTVIFVWWEAGLKRETKTGARCC